MREKKKSHTAQTAAIQNALFKVIYHEELLFSTVAFILLHIVVARHIGLRINEWQRENGARSQATQKQQHDLLHIYHLNSNYNFYGFAKARAHIYAFFATTKLINKIHSAAFWYIFMSLL